MDSMGTHGFHGCPWIRRVPSSQPRSGRAATLGGPGDHENFDLYDALDEVSLPQPDGHSRPGEWTAISLHGIRSIAHSPFLFVRKLVNNTMLAKEDKDGTMMSDDFTFEKAWLENVIS
mmetsp:Transcript_497/g.2156  ORF Transcript_497/g.2156 Transcript_497/m.2156 type:complete len:118 (+) Transcript_497:53-406(+)